MTEVTEETFTATTAEDQTKNYFFGDSQEKVDSVNAGSELPAGNYRIVDGMFCRVITGLNVSELREHIRRQECE